MAGSLHPLYDLYLPLPKRSDRVWESKCRTTEISVPCVEYPIVLIWSKGYDEIEIVDFETIKHIKHIDIVGKKMLICISETGSIKNRIAKVMKLGD